jgi:tripartite-type tricarboxylate transporter receptor subunit TctC
VEIDYQMMRGFFLPAGTSPGEASFYLDLLQRIRELPEWKAFIEAGAFEDRFLTGPAFGEWLEQADTRHRSLMRDAQLLR